MKRFFMILSVLVFALKAIAQTSIAGVSFGSDYSSAKMILEKKYGKAEYDSDMNSIHYRSKEYGGIYFHDLWFDFQYSGTRGYFNKCVLVVGCNTADEAKKNRDYIAGVVKKYYDLHESTLSNGFKAYQGGDDPTNKDNYGFFIDVIAPTAKGGQYIARLFYGPYNYVEENF